MTSSISISTTFENKKDAEKMAELLLAEKLVACAQLSGPITSYYRWQGKAETATEYTLTLKTLSQLYDKVEARLKENHPYDLPEIISHAITKGSKEYINWLESEVEDNNGK